MGNKNIGSGITLLHIEIALHYSKSQNSELVSYDGRDSSAAAQIHREFADAGLLEISGDHKHWKAIDRMRIYLETLCKVLLPANQTGKAPDRISQPDATLKRSDKFIGDDTINTRNLKIAAAMDEYLAFTPQSRL
ncbi:MAG: hypothetical protein WCA63_03690 [Gallionella sp.]